MGQAQGAYYSSKLMIHLRASCLRVFRPLSIMLGTLKGRVDYFATARLHAALHFLRDHK